MNSLLSENVKSTFDEILKENYLKWNIGTVPIESLITLLMGRMKLLAKHYQESERFVKAELIKRGFTFTFGVAGSKESSSEKVLVVGLINMSDEQRKALNKEISDFEEYSLMKMKETIKEFKDSIKRREEIKLQFCDCDRMTCGRCMELKGVEDYIRRLKERNV